MVSPTDAILGGMSIAAALLYFVVARVQGRRQVSPQARGPLRGFIIWWAGLGLLGLVTAFFRLGPGIETLGATGARIVIYTMFGGIFTMLAGLLYYLLFLYSGKRSTLYAAALFYGLLFLFMVWFIEGHAPHIGPHHDTGEAAFHLHADPPAWARLVFSAGLVLPPLGAAVAYFLLFFRTHDRTARYRILMVSFGFVLWFGFSLLGTIATAATGEAQGFAGRLTSQLLGVLAAVLVLLAYEPPASLRDRFRLRSIDERPPEQRDIIAPPRLDRVAVAR